jgi:hypothetical protein
MTDYRPSLKGCSTRSSEHRFSDDTEEEEYLQNEPRWETEHSKSRGNQQTNRWSHQLEIQDESENEEPERRKGKSLQRRQEHRTGGTKRGVIVADAIDQDTK